jgi:predicted HAD superfamily Cof-like phosphohydrolase
MFEDVARFHREILNVSPPAEPTLLTREMALERHKFLQEEIDEFYDACIHEGDVVGATDGLLDTIYVALGTLYMMGVPADRVWQFVQEANMQKKLGITSRGNKTDAVKPPGWQPPEIKISQLFNELRIFDENQS